MKREDIPYVLLSCSWILKDDHLLWQCKYVNGTVREWLGLKLDSLYN